MVLPYKASEFFWQSYFIPKPTLTEDNLPDQTGRVCLITGGYAGVGFEVASILYQHNATVYVAGRSESKAMDAIESITAQFPRSEGKLQFLKVDLADLATIKPAVEEFKRRESNLHWLNNNAGVMRAPTSLRGAQGMNVQFQTNIYGPFLFTKLLLPVLRQTAASEVPGSVRVTWAGSLATVLSQCHGGVGWTEDHTELAYEKDPDGAYSVSKAANYHLGVEFGKRSGNQDGVMHVVSVHHSDMRLRAVANQAPAGLQSWESYDRTRSSHGKQMGTHARCQDASVPPEVGRVYRALCRPLD